MKPMKHKLQPDSLLWYSAICHVKTSGYKGYIGHVRQMSKCKRRGSECCTYGWLSASSVVKALLVDRDVPSLGHRKICLDPKYKIVGVSKGKHKTHTEMCVLDFR